MQPNLPAASPFESRLSCPSMSNYPHESGSVNFKFYELWNAQYPSLIVDSNRRIAHYDHCHPRHFRECKAHDYPKIWECVELNLLEFHKLNFDMQIVSGLKTALIEHLEFFQNLPCSFPKIRKYEEMANECREILNQLSHVEKQTCQGSPLHHPLPITNDSWYKGRSRFATSPSAFPQGSQPIPSDPYFSWRPEPSSRQETKEEQTYQGFSYHPPMPISKSSAEMPSPAFTDSSFPSQGSYTIPSDSYFPWTPDQISRQETEEEQTYQGFSHPPIPISKSSSEMPSPAFTDSSFSSQRSYTTTRDPYFSWPHEQLARSQAEGKPTDQDFPYHPTIPSINDTLHRRTSSPHHLPESHLGMRPPHYPTADWESKRKKPVDAQEEKQLHPHSRSQSKRSKKSRVGLASVTHSQLTSQPSSTTKISHRKNKTAAPVTPLPQPDESRLDLDKWEKRIQDLLALLTNLEKQKYCS
ncbi:hypothetical protein PHSC3_000505 [Chlamydiales bacterium STE3]|nr:hypothetical protein PHSC3_000505 [Chlamydiales bacterium STE3]